jgi:outer membrane lipoprotein-sorting protein
LGDKKDAQMKRILQIGSLCLAIGMPALAQSGKPGAASQTQPAASPSPANPATSSSKQAAPTAAPGKTEAGGDLKSVLGQMNAAAANFKSAEADFDWDQFQKVVEEHDIQKGQIYLRRTKSGVDAAVNVVFPQPKQVVFQNGELKFYEPKIDQLTVRKVGNNRAEVESFMSLGFGARGDDLEKNYDVKMDGWEAVDGVKTAKLDLTPKSEKIKASINRVLLWIDPQQNISLKQQFFEPSGDYRLTHYRNIKVNGKVPDDVFRIKATSKTTVVRP